MPVHLQRADGKAFSYGEKVLRMQLTPGAPLKHVISQADSNLSSMSINFMGRRLDTSKSLADYQVEGDSVLTLVAMPQSVTVRPIVRETKGDKERVYGKSGTLYARCGGIFGVSAFVDRCMDSWMANPVLNANEAVASWHGKAQRCGFKFLVTQLMGNLTGGPQTYTGRDMVTSHRHLKINSEQWSSFMEDMNEICLDFNLPKDDVRDLTAIISSMMEDCILPEGEEAPPNPGHPNPPGDSLYARLGGVYPIALFADRLVDAMLGDSRVKIPLDGVTRSEPSLKYLFTELCCFVAGGPETLTSSMDPQTFLKLSSQECFYLLGCAKQAGDHMEAKVANDFIFALYENLPLIVDPQRFTALSTPLGWRCPKNGVRTHADMQRSLNKSAQDMGLPLRFMYVPGGLSYLDDGCTPADHEERSKIADAHGFRRATMSTVKSASEAAAGAGNRGV